MDANYCVVSINAAAENLLRVSRDSIRGVPLSQYFHDHAELTELFDKAAQNDNIYAREMLLHHTSPSATTVDVDCRVSPYTGAGVDMLLVEFSDITARLRIARDRELRSQHTIGRKIIRQLAHEIKNPLGGLRGAAQLLQRQIQNENLIDYTDVIIAEADRLAALVDALLGPGGALVKKPVNIHDVLEHVVRIVDAEENNALSWQRDYDPSLPHLQLDRDQMIQAVLNLVRNAASATEHRGTIKLRTRALTNETIGDARHRVIASIQIEDDGPGIDPSIRDSIFYPLVTGSATGTGIGLPLSQELINRHDGLIECTSEPGQTIFQIRLPVPAVS